MVPTAYVPFFTTCATAGAALIGLLFVAISIAPERIVTRDAPVERQAIAVSTFTALVNAFFVSLLALVPTPILGPTAAVAGAVALLNTGVVAVHLARHWRQWRSWPSLLRRSFLVALSCLVYGMQTYQGSLLIRDSRDGSAVTTLTYLVVAAYAIGLQRAWQLLGARRSFGLLSWLNLLRDVRDDDDSRRTDAGVKVAATDAPHAVRDVRRRVR
jgi:hypothetical protein